MNHLFALKTRRSYGCNMVDFAFDSTVPSKWLCCGHCALKMAALWPLCARSGSAVATVRSKWRRCGHCAPEMAALWPLGARNGCAVATVRSNWLRCGHRALETAALWPLCARNGCAVATVRSLRLCLSFLRSHCAASSCALCGFTGAVRRLCESSIYIYILYIYIYIF